MKWAPLFHSAVWLAHTFWVSPKQALSRERPEQPTVFVHHATEKAVGYLSDACVLQELARLGLFPLLIS